MDWRDEVRDNLRRPDCGHEHSSFPDEDVRVIEESIRRAGYEVQPRQILLEELARLIAGLQVPISMGMPLGVAKEAWSTVIDELGLSGWNDDAAVLSALRRKLLVTS